MTATTDAGAWVMPFGKHQGKPLAQIPRGYLSFMLTLDLHAETREAIDVFLKQPRLVSPQAELPGTKPRRKASRKAGPGPATATCARCELPGSAARPLVHADCVSDEVPF